MTKFEIIQIGEVQIDTSNSRFEYRENNVSKLIIFEDFKEALEKIEEYSHVIISYWAHLIDPQERKLRKVNPGGKKEFSLRGVFSSRSQARPNPICLTTIELLERNDNILFVKDLDALDKSPIIDIKPHAPQFDAPLLFDPPIWTYCFRKIKKTESL